MGIWQIIYIVWLTMSLGVALAKHGKPIEGKHNFWASSIAVAAQILILAFGGFFG